MPFIYQGATMNKASIAILKQKQNDAKKLEKIPSYKGMSGGKSKTPSNKISHEARKARIVARSIANDPKNVKKK